MTRQVKCAGCAQPVELEGWHVTVTLQDEIEDEVGIVSVRNSQVLSHMHQGCAVIVRENAHPGMEKTS